MYELVKIGERTYYINCPARMGIYVISGQDVALIDSGNDKEAGKKALRILMANGFTLRMILNTHSHADHIGGNCYLQQQTGCSVYAPGIDRAFVQHPILEPSLLYGGYPVKELRNKFLLAQESDAKTLTPSVLPQGLSMLPVNGHSYSMAAIHTSDDVWFLADCFTGEAVLQKYHITFLYDVKGYLESLQTVGGLAARLFVPAHAEPCEDIRNLVKMNENKVHEIIAFLKGACHSPTGFDSLLKAVFDHYLLAMDFNQYVLVGSTIRSYLSYLHDLGEMNAMFDGNTLKWQTA